MLVESNRPTEIAQKNVSKPEVTTLKIDVKHNDVYLTWREAEGEQQFHVQLESHHSIYPYHEKVCWALLMGPHIIRNLQNKTFDLHADIDPLDFMINKLQNMSLNQIKTINPNKLKRYRRWRKKFQDLKYSYKGRRRYKPSEDQTK